jgi:adenosylcobinamide-GDP ribazoletransferase
MVFNPDIVIALVLLVLVLSNGGFHLDGLSDTFDALASKSTGDAAADREKRLTIMKGSTAGPIGVTAIIFALGLKYLALVDISNFSSPACYSSLLLMPVLSKWTMVVSLYRGEPARQDGLGQFFISGTGFIELAVSTVQLVLVLALSGIAFRSCAPESFYLFYAGVLALLYLSSGIWVGYFKGKLGGLTGDTLGAVSEATEISFLLLVIMWSRLSI